MNRVAVISSNIASMGYDPVAQVVEVEFAGGRVYHYIGVDQAAWDGRAESESVGKWVARYLKVAHEAVVGPYEPEEVERCEDEHTWPAVLDDDAQCEVCNLRYGEWEQAQ